MRELDHRKIGMNISILERVMKIYFNRGLENFGIGWGQQFALECIYENPGITALELAADIHVDKATITKLIKKLTALPFNTIMPDDNDGRIRHIYLTEAAGPSVKRIKDMHEEFFCDIAMGLDMEQIGRMEQVMDVMIDNSAGLYFFSSMLMFFLLLP